MQDTRSGAKAGYSIPRRANEGCRSRAGSVSEHGDVVETNTWASGTSPFTAMEAPRHRGEARWAKTT